MNNFRTFNDVKSLEVLNEYYNAGLYISATMLVMELDISNINFGNVGNISLYDTTDLSEYMAANQKGFMVASPIEQIREELINNNSKIYVLREKEKIASSVTVWDYDDDTVETENIFTVPKLRGRGYAFCVLSKALADASAEGKKHARLTVYSTDIPAIKMYRKFGFKITKVLQEFSHE